MEESVCECYLCVAVSIVESWSTQQQGRTVNEREICVISNLSRGPHIQIACIFSAKQRERQKLTGQRKINQLTGCHCHLLFLC